MEKIFGKNSETKIDVPMEGFARKVLAYNNEMMIVEVKLDKGTTLPAHKHVHTQCTYVVSGKLEFTLEDKVYILEAEDSIVSPSDAEHKVVALEDSLVVDAFNPMREDFI